MNAEEELEQIEQEVETLVQSIEQLNRETVAKCRKAEAKLIALVRVVQDRLLDAGETPREVWAIQ